MPAPATNTRRARRPQAPALRFDQRLVLNQWILSLFEEDSFIPLTEGLQDAALEGVDENNVSRFHHVIAARLFERHELTRDVLLQYRRKHRSTQRRRTAPELQASAASRSRACFVLTGSGRVGYERMKM